MKKPDKYEISLWIKDKALQQGFSACGISKAGYADTEAQYITDWLRKDRHGEMTYMEKNLRQRLDPRLLFDGAESVISFMLNYYPGHLLPGGNNYRISKYAYGKRYQQLIRKKLQKIIDELNEIAGPFQARAFCDSAPMLDKYWARKGGLGWIGKNTLLIHPGMGSFHFLGEIITNLELQYDQNSGSNLCGDCTKCIDHCPTGALQSARTIDATKCITYLTVEYMGALPAGLKEKFGEWIYGCDICQDVCPFNRKAVAHHEKALKPNPELFKMKKEDWNKLQREKFEELFKGTSVSRIGYETLMRNIIYVQTNFAPEQAD